MFPHSEDALAKLAQAKTLIDEAMQIFTPSIKISSFTPNPLTMSPGDPVTLTGLITGNIVRIKIYDKNATVLHDSFVPENDGTWTAALDTTKVALDDHMWFTAEGYSDSVNNTGRVSNSIGVISKARAVTSPPVETPTPTTNDPSPDNPPSETPSESTPSTDNPPTETPSQETPTETPPTETPPATDNPTTDNPTTDTPASADPYAGTPAAGMTLVFDKTYNGDDLDSIAAGSESNFEAVRSIMNGNIVLHSDEGDKVIPEKGYFEIRAKFPLSTGEWSNLFSDVTGLESDNGQADQNIYGSSVQVAARTNHSWPGATDFVNSDESGTGFAVYGMRITDDEIINYIDGEETVRYAKSVSMEANADLTDYEVGPLRITGYIPLSVDSIRVFKEA
jgi:hypothetical protein